MAAASRLRRPGAVGTVVLVLGLVVLGSSAHGVGTPGGTGGGTAGGGAPLWDVSGRWDGFNGAEYLVLHQRRDGRVDVTVRHTCAVGHVERGVGRIRGQRLRARVEPGTSHGVPPPPSCVRFADIDVRVHPDGRRMAGTYRTDRDAGALLYLARHRARSLVRFRPGIARARGGKLRVSLRARPRLPAGALASVRLCLDRRCQTRRARHAPLFRPLGRGCGTVRVRVRFAGASALAQRRLCL